MACGFVWVWTFKSSVVVLLFAQVGFWYPLNIITGGTTAKIMLAAKDNFLGKYIYRDTLDRNLAAVIYRVSFLSCFDIVNLISEFYLWNQTTYSRPSRRLDIFCHPANLAWASSASFSMSIFFFFQDCILSVPSNN